MAHDDLLGAYLEDWLLRRRSQLRPATVRNYRQTLRRYLVPQLGDRRLDELDHPTIERHYARLLEEGGRGGTPLSPRTIRLVHAVLRRALEDAVLDGLIEDNPARSTRPPRHNPADGLRWRDVDLAAAQVRIRRSLSVVDGVPRLLGTKTSRSRRLSIGASVVDALRREGGAAADAPRAAAGGCPTSGVRLMSTISPTQPGTGSSDPAMGVEEAVLFVRASQAAQLERTAAIVDGATLAAEQVQDKRIELLEGGPEASVTDLFVAFGVTFFLESFLATRLLRRTAQAFFTSRIRSQTRVIQRLRLENDKALAQLAQRVPNPRGMGFLKNTPSRVIDRGTLARMHQVQAMERAVAKQAGKIGGQASSAAEIGVVLAKASAAAAPEAARLARQVEVAPGDSPGVALRRLMQGWASASRYAIMTEHAIHEHDLITGMVEPARVCKPLEWPSIGGELAALRNDCALMFEFQLWAMLVHEQFAIRKRRQPTMADFALHLKRLDGRLLGYWLKRFIHPETGRPYAELPVRSFAVLANPVDARIPDMAAHMWTVIQSLQQCRLEPPVRMRK